MMMKPIPQKQLRSTRLRELCGVLRRNRGFGNGRAYQGGDIEAVCYTRTQTAWGWAVLGPDGYAEHGYAKGQPDAQAIPKLYAEKVAIDAVTRRTCFAIGCSQQISEARLMTGLRTCCDECEVDWQRARQIVGAAQRYIEEAE